MKIVVLGSGTSTGVPEVACQCVVCKSQDSRDKRLRCSTLVISDEGKKILIDCSPDFREQAIRHNIDNIDAILITHEHYDHTYGLDDLRTIAYAKDLPIYGRKSVLDSIRNRMHYAFGENHYPGTARLTLNEISNFDESFILFDCKVTPIRVMHGKLEIFGFRINDFVYITDMKTIDAKEVEKMQGAKLMIVNALRYQKEHPSHHSTLDLIEFRKQYGFENTPCFLTHISHHAPLYKEFQSLLAPNMYPAYDTLTIELNDDEYKIVDTYQKEEAFDIESLGIIDYEEAWEKQKTKFNELIEAKRKGEKPKGIVYVCQHYPVLTMGLHAKNQNLLVSDTLLESKGIKVYKIERGGDITYHNPNQLVIYPILDLERYNIGIKQYIEILEDSIIELLNRYNIKSGRKSSAPGVWLDIDNISKERKIAAIGVKASRFVTMHGLALNVSNDLSGFELINPCGFIGGRVTSIEKELGYPADIYAIAPLLTDIIAKKLAEYL